MRNSSPKKTKKTEGLGSYLHYPHERLPLPSPLLCPAALHERFRVLSWKCISCCPWHHFHIPSSATHQSSPPSAATPHAAPRPHHRREHILLFSCPSPTPAVITHAARRPSDAPIHAAGAGPPVLVLVRRRNGQARPWRRRAGSDVSEKGEVDEEQHSVVLPRWVVVGVHLLLASGARPLYLLSVWVKSGERGKSEVTNDANFF